MPLAGAVMPSDTVRVFGCPRGVMSEPSHKAASSKTGAYAPQQAVGASKVPTADMATIEAWLKDHKISEVECLVPDMTGNARGKFIPAHQFTASREIKLPESIMVQTVTGEYTDDHWDFVEHCRLLQGRWRAASTVDPQRAALRAGTLRGGWP